MKTDINLIQKSLIILNIEEISLEEAISKASIETNLGLVDNIKTIRDFLCEENLLKHNPKLKYLNQKEYIENTNIAYINNVIDVDFINDHLTEKCIILINGNLLNDYLLKALRR